MNKKRIHQSLARSSGFRGKFVIKDPTFCPNCNLEASGYSEIVEKFGLRDMGDGTIRVQSWCKDCRGYRFGNMQN